MSWLRKAAASYSRFMQGRYGHDSLNGTLLWVWLAVAAINLVFHSWILAALNLFLCILVLFRMLSKNTVRRQRENAVWYSFCRQVKGAYHRAKVRVRDRKEYRFFRCPACKAPIRMPKMTGKFNIRCRKCGASFEKEFKK